VKAGVRFGGVGYAASERRWASSLKVSKSLLRTVCLPSVFGSETGVGECEGRRQTQRAPTWRAPSRMETMRRFCVARWPDTPHRDPCQLCDPFEPASPLSCRRFHSVLTAQPDFRCRHGDTRRTCCINLRYWHDHTTLRE